MPMTDALRQQMDRSLANTGNLDIYKEAQKTLDADGSLTYEEFIEARQMMASYLLGALSLNVDSETWARHVESARKYTAETLANRKIGSARRHVAHLQSAA